MSSLSEARTLWRLLAALTASFGVLSALVLWLAISVGRPAPAGALAAGLAVAVPFAFAAFAMRRAAQAEKKGA